MENYFQNKVEITPDFVFEGVMFDPKYREENNLPTPLTSKRKPDYDIPGAYVFFEPCNQNAEIEIMYVGRSNTLRNRLNGHWGNYTPLYKGINIVENWWTYCWDNDYPFCPHIAIFVSYGNIKDLEHWLMQLKPRFNTH